MPTKKIEKQNQNNHFISSSQKYSKEVLNCFINFSLKNIWIIIILVCSAIILACSISMFAILQLSDALLYLFIGIFFALYPFFIKFILKKQNSKNLNTTDNYRFFEDKLEVDSFDSFNNKFSTATVLYNRLVKVKTYKDYGYIYINKQMAYIVSKQNFKTEEEFNFVLTRISKAIGQEKK